MSNEIFSGTCRIGQDKIVFRMWVDLDRVRLFLKEFVKSNPGRLRRSISEVDLYGKRRNESYTAVLMVGAINRRNGIIPDAMIYMTDGYGLFPDDCPIRLCGLFPNQVWLLVNFLLAMS